MLLHQSAGENFELTCFKSLGLTMFENIQRIW